MSPSSPGRRRSGWIVGSVAGTAIVVGVVLAVLFTTGVLGAEHGSAAARSGSATHSPSSAGSSGRPTSHPSPSSAPSSGHAAGAGGTGARRGHYRYVDDFCHQINWRPYVPSGWKESTDHPLTDVSQGDPGGTGTMSCLVMFEDDDYNIVSVEVDADVFDTPRAAAKDLTSLAEDSIVDATPRALPGDWTRGKQVGTPMRDELDYAAYVQDGNLSMGVAVNGFDVPWGRNARRMAIASLHDLMHRLR